MREYTEVPSTRHARTRLVCDICGREAPKLDGEADWEEDALANISVEVKASIGHADGYGGGSGKSFEADVCPECFEKKLVPWLRENGCKAQWKEYDY